MSDWAAADVLSAEELRRGQKTLVYAMTAPISMRGAVRRSGNYLKWPKPRAYQGLTAPRAVLIGAVGAVGAVEPMATQERPSDCASPMLGAVTPHPTLARTTR